MEKEKIIGFKQTEFTIKDSGKEMKGVTIYTTKPIPSNVGKGVYAERFFLSSEKVSALKFELQPQLEIFRRYNRWGNIDTLELCDDLGDVSIE